MSFPFVIIVIFYEFALCYITKDRIPEIYKKRTQYRKWWWSGRGLEAADALFIARNRWSSERCIMWPLQKHDRKHKRGHGVSWRSCWSLTGWETDPVLFVCVLLLGERRISPTLRLVGGWLSVLSLLALRSGRTTVWLGSRRSLTACWRSGCPRNTSGCLTWCSTTSKLTYSFNHSLTQTSALTSKGL